MKNVVLSFLLIFAFGCRVDWQPGLSADPKYLQKFDQETQFPYIASPEAKQRIQSGHSKIKNGMTGDDVLVAIDRPDEIQRLAFAFGPTQGWSWTYLLNKEFARAPDNSDNYVRIFFDTSGLVTKLDVQFEAPARPTPLPDNMKMKIANVRE